jgi:hypothetical protein
MKSHKIYLVSFLLLIVATISNCTVQKRSYRNGYYVSWNKKTIQPVKVSKHIETTSKETFIKEIPETVKINAVQSQGPLLASVKKYVKSEVKRLNIKPLKLVEDSCGDLITLRDGTDIEAKVIEVGSKVIKYKRCDNLSGPLIVVNIENVFMIKYANGTKEVFKKEEVKEKKNTENYQSTQEKPVVVRKNNTMAVTSFILLFFSFLIIPAPISFIFGLVALGEFKKEPGKYKNKWMAQIPVILGYIVLGIIFLAIIASFLIM